MDIILLVIGVVTSIFLMVLNIHHQNNSANFKGFIVDRSALYGSVCIMTLIGSMHYGLHTTSMIILALFHLLAGDITEKKFPLIGELPRILGYTIIGAVMWSMTKYYTDVTATSVIAAYYIMWIGLFVFTLRKIFSIKRNSNVIYKCNKEGNMSVNTNIFSLKNKVGAWYVFTSNGNFRGEAVYSGDVLLVQGDLMEATVWDDKGFYRIIPCKDVEMLEVSPKPSVAETIMIGIRIGALTIPAAVCWYATYSIPYTIVLIGLGLVYISNLISLYLKYGRSGTNKETLYLNYMYFGGLLIVVLGMILSKILI